MRFSLGDSYFQAQTSHGGHYGSIPQAWSSRSKKVVLQKDKKQYIHPKLISVWIWKICSKPYPFFLEILQLSFWHLIFILTFNLTFWKLIRRSPTYSSLSHNALNLEMLALCFLELLPQLVKLSPSCWFVLVLHILQFRIGKWKRRST